MPLVLPIIGKAQDTAVWESYAKEVDIIVEAVADYEDIKTGDAVKDVLVKIINQDKKKIVFYTSGTWVIWLYKAITYFDRYMATLHLEPLQRLKHHL